MASARRLAQTTVRAQRRTARERGPQRQPTLPGPIVLRWAALGKPGRGNRRCRERATGIEPAFSAWEADVLPLNYARVSRADCIFRLVILSDRSIREELEAGRIVIDPLD